MVSVDDIIEITDSSYEKNGVKLQDRRYWVRKVKSDGGVNAAPIVPENSVYKQHPSGVNWDTLGLSDKGRPRSLPSTVFQTVGTMQGDKDGKAISSTASIGTSTSTPSPTPAATPVTSPLATTSLFGGTRTDTSNDSDSGDTEAPVSEEVQEILDVTDGMSDKGEEVTISGDADDVPDFLLRGANSPKVEKRMVADGMCFNTDLLSPFEQAREIDTCKIPTYPWDADTEYQVPEVVLDKKTGDGFRVRVCFSTPINYTNPQHYSSQEDLNKSLVGDSSKNYMIVREYQIGSKVKDICGSKAKMSKPLQWHTNGKPFNEEAEVVSIRLQWAPFFGENTPENRTNCPTITPPSKIYVTLQSSDGNTFNLEHEVQEVVFTPPVIAPPSTSGGFSMFAGHSTSAGDDGARVDDSEIATTSASTVAGSSIEIEPEGERDVNRFPSTDKGAAPSMNDVRSILAMTYDHDHPAFADYEMEYEIDWDKQPSVMSSEATEYVRVILEVKEGEGIATNRFPGKWENNAMLKKHPEMWSNYPRRVILVFPQADSEFLLCPTDEITPDKDSEDLIDFQEFPRGTWIDEVQEVKYYESKGVIRDIQLLQRYQKTEIKGIGQKETKEVTLTKTLKVGELYEFASKEPASSLRVPLKGRLVKVEVVKDASRETIFQSLVSERRSLRVIEDYEVFFATEKDDKGKTRFVIVIKNESGKPNSGQIIRIDLGKSKQQQGSE